MKIHLRGKMKLKMRRKDKYRKQAIDFQHMYNWSPWNQNKTNGYNYNQ